MTMPVLFLSHGGGPLPLLGDPGHQPMLDAFADIRQSLPNPKTILLISAHWEAESFTLYDSQDPGLLYDYYNFPPESYEISYPTKGNPALAHQLADDLKAAGFDIDLEGERGFDHGMFVPLKLLWPDADIPTIQLSLRQDMDPAAHLALGEALQTCRRDGVMVIGSGFTFHNLDAMFKDRSPESRQQANAFADWLGDLLCGEEASPEHRHAGLESWSAAPGARFCHPREEHLLPLHVCLGAANNKAAAQQWRMQLMHYPAQCFLWA